MKKVFGYLMVIGLCVLCMAPNRRPHDHIGNFNFKVEIEGVTQGVVEAKTTETVVCPAPDTPEDGETSEPLLKVRFSKDLKPPTNLKTLTLRGDDGAAISFQGVALKKVELKDGEYQVLMSYTSCTSL
jgi:hypothetical protein